MYKTVNKCWQVEAQTTRSSFGIYQASLAVYEKGGKVILISGSSDKKIKAWDLDSYNVITTLEGHGGGIIPLTVYTDDERQYLASGGNAREIKIWRLDDFSLVKTINADNLIFALVGLDIDEKKILASGNNEGKIQLWNLNDNACMKTIQAHSDTIWTLCAVQCDGEVCLTSGILYIKINICKICQSSEEEAFQ